MSQRFADVNTYMRYTAESKYVHDATGYNQHIGLARAELRELINEGRHKILHDGELWKEITERTKM